MFSYRLRPEFVEQYKTRVPPFGFADAAGNSVGEITFIRTYSRTADEGTKEFWWESCERVVNGMFSIQKDHAVANRLPWSDDKAHESAEECYDRLFELKWTPPGRGLWAMGTPMVMQARNSAALQNCGFASTGSLSRNSPGKTFGWIMEALMLGIGVGFDTEGETLGFPVCRPKTTTTIWSIPDSREGWVQSLEVVINAFLAYETLPIFDYSRIRPAGSPIKGFGGTASGPGPLKQMHERLTALLWSRVGDTLDSRLIVDIVNLIGVCVVSGNVRRSATIALGDAEDKVFPTLKNIQDWPERNSQDPENPGWGWMSNNTIKVEEHKRIRYEDYVDQIASTGEPGLAWLHVMRDYGRLIDLPNYKDHRVKGVNPCGEQPLEDRELCTLVEVHIMRHKDLEDFKRTLKFAFMYAKTTTLVATHWPETNAIMQRNRRIGTSITGITTFADTYGIPELKKWMDLGYQHITYYDRVYSEWLCVRESIKKTTVKPSGSVSLLSGSAPGVHWAPGARFYLRAMRFGNDDALLPLLRSAGYTCEPDIGLPDTTTVVYFPIKSDARRSEKEVSLWEKASIANIAQHYWSDNAVSVTLSFNPETEKQYIAPLLYQYEGTFKAVSFLPMGNTVYKQPPYQEISEQEYLAYAHVLQKIDMSQIYTGTNNAVELGDKYCTNDSCMI